MPVLGTAIEKLFLEIGIKTDDLKRQAPQTERALTKVTSGIIRNAKAALGTAAAITGMTATVAGLSYAAIRATKAVVGLAGQMETFRLQLESVTRSEQKAADLLQWITQFAARTPFEIPGLVEATVQLEAYGQNAQKWLPLVGEWAAAMGMRIQDASLAVSRALIGSAEGFEIMRNRGISSAKLLAAGWSGSYQDIESVAKALERVLGEFSGGMEKQSRTFRGIMSNISDQLTQFRIRIANYFFDFLKDRLDDLRAYLVRLSETGELERWAERLGKAIQLVIALVSPFVKALGAVIDITDSLLTKFEQAFGHSNLEAMNQNIESLTQSFEQQRETLENLLRQYQQYADEASEQGQTVEQAAQSNDALREIIQSIVEIVPEAATAWNQYGEALGISVDAVERFLERQRALLSQELRDVGKTYTRQIQESYTQLEELEMKRAVAAEQANVIYQELLRTRESLTEEERRALENEKSDEWMHYGRVRRLKALEQEYQTYSMGIQGLTNDIQRQSGALEALRARFQAFLGAAGLRGVVQSFLELHSVMNRTEEQAVQYYKNLNLLADALGVSPQQLENSERLVSILREAMELQRSPVQVGEITTAPLVDWKSQIEASQIALREAAVNADKVLDKSVRTQEAILTHAVLALAQSNEKFRQYVGLTEGDIQNFQKSIQRYAVEGIITPETEDALNRVREILPQLSQDYDELRQAVVALREEQLKSAQQALEASQVAEAEILQTSVARVEQVAERENWTYQQRIEAIQRIGELWARTEEGRAFIGARVADLIARADIESVRRRKEVLEKLQEFSDDIQEERLRAFQSVQDKILSVSQASTLDMLEYRKLETQQSIRMMEQRYGKSQEIERLLTQLQEVEFAARQRLYQNAERAYSSIYTRRAQTLADALTQERDALIAHYRVLLGDTARFESKREEIIRAFEGEIRQARIQEGVTPVPAPTPSPEVESERKMKAALTVLQSGMKQADRVLSQLTESELDRLYRAGLITTTQLRNIYQIKLDYAGREGKVAADLRQKVIALDRQVAQEFITNEREKLQAGVESLEDYKRNLEERLALAREGTEEEKAYLEELASVNRQLAEETREQWIEAYREIASETLNLLQSVTGGLDDFSQKILGAGESFFKAIVAAMGDEYITAAVEAVKGLLKVADAYANSIEERFSSTVRKWRDELRAAMKSAPEQFGRDISSIFVDYFLQGEGNLRTRLQTWVEQNIVRTIIDTMVQGMMRGLAILPEVEYWAKMLAQVLRGASLEELKTLAKETGVYTQEELKRYQGAAGRRALTLSLKETIQFALGTTVRSALNIIDEETTTVVNAIEDALGASGLEGVTDKATEAQTEIEKAAASLGQAITATQGNILISLWQTATGYLESINRGVWTLVNRSTPVGSATVNIPPAERELGLERSAGLVVA